MASLIFAAGVLSYDALKKQHAKRSARKTSRTTAFSALGQENAARIAALQSKDACFCQRSDWRGGGCEAHGYVPAAGEVGGPPLYEDVVEYDAEEGGRVERRRSMPPPEYRDGNAPFAAVGSGSDEGGRGVGSHGGGGYVYRRGREEGAWASRSAEDLEEVRRINEERRGRGRKGLMGRWRRGGHASGEGVVR